MPTSAAPSRPATLDQLNAAQHQVRQLLERYGMRVGQELRGGQREQLRRSISVALDRLLRVEDERVYPRLQPLLDAATLQAARDDHARIMQQLLQVRECSPGAPLDAAMTELAQLTFSHLAFENEHLLPALPQIDTPALREQVAAGLADAPPR